MSLLALARKSTFRHGVHPDEMKEMTRSLPIERMPFVAEYVIPLSQHTGAPSRPLVGPGTRVHRGEMIAAPDGFISTAVPLFTHVFTGDEPSGSYVWVVLLVQAGGNPTQTLDWLGYDVATFDFVP